MPFPPHPNPFLAKPSSSHRSNVPEKANNIFLWAWARKIYTTNNLSHVSRRGEGGSMKKNTKPQKNEPKHRGQFGGPGDPIGYAWTTRRGTPRGRGSQLAKWIRKTALFCVFCRMHEDSGSDISSFATHPRLINNTSTTYQNLSLSKAYLQLINSSSKPHQQFNNSSSSVHQKLINNL